MYLVLGGANKRGSSLRLATCPGLSEQRSRLNQSRWSSSIPCCRHHVSPAGDPSRGGPMGPKGRQGGVSKFFPNSTGHSGKEEELCLQALAPDLGSHPLQDRTCTRGLASVAANSHPRNDLFWNLESDRTTQELFYIQELEKSSSSVPLQPRGSRNSPLLSS